MLQEANWVDGRVTAGHQSAGAKNNMNACEIESMRSAGILFPGKGRPVVGSKMMGSEGSEKSPDRSAGVGTAEIRIIGLRMMVAW